MSHPNGLLPDAILDEFRQYRGAGDPNRWAIGDKLDDTAVEYAGKITLRQLYRAVALETELKVSTCRVLHETSRATAESLRAEFDVLTFQHFRELRYLDDDKLRRSYLDWCVKSADEFGGRPAPAAVLARKVQRELGTEPPAPTGAELAERAAGLLRRALEVENTPERSRAKWRAALDVLEQA